MSETPVMYMEADNMSHEHTLAALMSEQQSQLRWWQSTNYAQGFAPETRAIMIATYQRNIKALHEGIKAIARQADRSNFAEICQGLQQQGLITQAQVNRLV
jgi:hypothetical protein